MIRGKKNKIMNETTLDNIFKIFFYVNNWSSTLGISLIFIYFYLYAYIHIGMHILMHICTYAGAHFFFKEGSY